MKTKSWKAVFRMHRGDLKNLVKQFAEDLSRDFNKAIMEDSTDELAIILQKTFDNAPNSGYVHNIPGWAVLCNLCEKEG